MSGDPLRRTDEDTQRDDHVKTQREDTICNPRRETSAETNPTKNLDIQLLISELWEN